jgi:Uma2 family endonuclease
MPAVVTDTPPLPVPQEPSRKRWTRAECEALESAGLFGTQHLELIEGELIDKMGKQRPHSNGVLWLMRCLVGVFGWDFVQPEVVIDVAPLDNPTNQPEPDVIVLARPVHEFPVRHPQPADLRLVAEVADSSLSFDRSVKAQLYARAGIVEYWVLDVNGGQLIVHREPCEGKYAVIHAYGREESVAPLAAPDSLCRVADLLPPR